MSYYIRFFIQDFWGSFETVALQFVRDIFELPAKSAKLIEGNQIFAANSNVDSDFNIAVDILVELDNHAQVIIEVQLAKQVFFINRIWAYLCKQVNDNIEKLKQKEDQSIAIYKKITTCLRGSYSRSKLF